MLMTGRGSNQIGSFKLRGGAFRVVVLDMPPSPFPFRRFFVLLAQKRIVGSDVEPMLT